MSSWDSTPSPPVVRHRRQQQWISACSNGDQRWAPGAYNPRALGVSLGISGHRADLVKSWLKPDRELVKTERELIKAESGTDRRFPSDRADQVDCLQYPAEIERVSGSIVT